MFLTDKDIEKLGLISITFTFADYMRIMRKYCKGFKYPDPDIKKVIK